VSDSRYAGPATSITQVILGAGPVDPAAVDAATTRLRTEPGLAGVVVAAPDGTPALLVVHELLLKWTPRGTNEDIGRWLQRLANTLAFKGYSLSRADGADYVEPPHAVGRARRLVRQGKALGRMPSHVRAQYLLHRRRRAAFLRQLRLRAWLAGAQLEVDVAQDLVVDRGIRVQVRPGRSRLQIGPRCAIGAGTVLRLGGELVMTRNVELRFDVALNVKGRLRLQGRNILGRGTMVHADGDMLWEWGASSSEYTTVLDSNHDFDGSLVHVHDQGVAVADVVIGAGALLGAKSTVMPGVRIGRGCLVGASSVVTRDVADGWIAVGSPAKPLRKVVVE
jgi:acetyltransferase-like isoleucine patch superfamily enzyme